MPTERTVRWLKSAWVAGIVAFGDLDHALEPVAPPEVAMADKIAHFGVFHPGSVPDGRPGRQDQDRSGGAHSPGPHSGGLQAMVPFRSCEAADVTADLLGMLSGSPWGFPSGF